MKTIRIGTRESRLAVVQAELVANYIRTELPSAEVVLVKMKTTGDLILEHTLDAIGGKGLFIKELDEALLHGDVDLCVHSYKDMPSEQDSGLPVVAVGGREDCRDVLVLPEGCSRLEDSKPIACSSMRRRVQLGALFPGQATEPVRGNVITRLKKLDEGCFAALVLAYAGLKRLGLEHRVSRVFSESEMIPASCQGVLAVQGRRHEDYSYLKGFHDTNAALTTSAERAFIKTLGCGCGAPVGVHAVLEAGQLKLSVMAADTDGHIRRDSISGRPDMAETLGVTLATSLSERWSFGW